MRVSQATRETEKLAEANVSEIVGRSKLGTYQVGIAVLCGLCVILYGFAIQAMGFVAPALIQDWQIPNPALGPVFSAALVGVLVGQLLFSALADKLGRRPVIIGATLIFSVFTFLTAQTSSLNALLVIRFIAGLGLGAIMPNATALVGEYSPIRSRVTVMMLVANGANIGAMIGGFIAVWLIPTFGWRSVFYVGGVAPFVIGLLMIFVLPESLQFMVLHGRKPRKIAKSLKRVAPSVPIEDGTRYVVMEERKKGVPVVHLFHEGRGTVTVLLWTINFMNLFSMFLLSSWLPTVIRDAGHSTSIAVLAGTVLQLGGVIGALGLAWLISRSGFIPVIAASFATACISVALIGQFALSLAVLFTVVFVTGWCLFGIQNGLNALSATYYPTYLRSTGIGWGLGIGRIGSIVGPLVVGEMMSRNWPIERLFLFAAVPPLIAGIVAFCLRGMIKPQAS